MFLLGVVCLAATACSGAKPGEEFGMKDQAAIRSRAEAFVKAFNDKSVDQVLTIYAENSVFMPPNQPVIRGKDALKTFYDDLFKVELTTYLRDYTAAYDLITSADTLVYFGPLEDVVNASANALRPGGRLVFTVEQLDGDPDAGYVLCAHGRYAHARSYVERVLAEARLVPEITTAQLRMEAGDPVVGLVVRATKPEVQD